MDFLLSSAAFGSSLCHEHPAPGLLPALDPHALQTSAVIQGMLLDQ